MTNYAMQNVNYYEQNVCVDVVSNYSFHFLSFPLPDISKLYCACKI
jgi:hypothetical protein